MYKFEEQQLKGIAQLQEKFLKNIYPFLTEDTFHDECIELRPISRNKKNYIKSLNLWRFDKKGRERHFEFMNKLNGQPFCLYYSLFTFNYDEECVNREGKKYEKGKINKQNSLYTQVVGMDFDNILISEHEEYLDILKSIGIESISIFTGHGFQDLILLNEKVYDKNILKKFTYLLLSRGFPVDENIIDSSRVFRMPYSFNCKEFDSNSEYFNLDPQGIPVKIIKETNKRYSIEDIFNRIESLDVKNKEIVKEYNFIKINNSQGHKCNIDSNNKNIKNVLEFKSIEEEYNMISFKKMPEAIQNMLRCTKENYRNSVMLFLITFFRNKIGLSFNSILSMLKIWGKRCDPPLETSFVEKEVKRLYSYNYKGTGKYTSELAREFGYISFDTYKRDNKVLVPNELINNYSLLSDGSVKIYLMMKLFEKVEDIKEWTREDICRVADISLKTFNRNIKDLLKLGYLDKARGIKMFGEKYKFYINKYYNKDEGFTTFETGTLENMVYNKNKSLTNGEIKLYTLLCKMISTSENETCYASQEYIAQCIGKKRNSISEMTDSLAIKRYIKKDVYMLNYVPHCMYTLNY